MPRSSPYRWTRRRITRKSGCGRRSGFRCPSHRSRNLRGYERPAIHRNSFRLAVLRSNGADLQHRTPHKTKSSVRKEWVTICVTRGSRPFQIDDVARAVGGEASPPTLRGHPGAPASSHLCIKCKPAGFSVFWGARDPLKWGDIKQFTLQIFSISPFLVFPVISIKQPSSNFEGVQKYVSLK